MTEPYRARDRTNHINRPVRTARAVVQHHNAAIHKRQFCYSALPPRPTSRLRCGHKVVRGRKYRTENIVWTGTSYSSTDASIAFEMSNMILMRTVSDGKTVYMLMELNAGNN